MSQTWGTCRYCRQTAHQDRLLKYSVRHYAHHLCWLEAGGKLEDLQPWQVANFPHRLLAGRGLLEKAVEIAKAAA